MLLQFKNACRQSLNLRLYSVAAAVLLAVVFSIAGAMNAPESIMITGIVFSSIILTAILIICIMADVAQYKSIFSQPHGYLNMMAPVKPVKILLPRIITMAVLDLVSFAIGIASIVVLSTRNQGTGFTFDGAKFISSGVINGLLLSIAGYIFMLSLIAFTCAVAKTILFKSRLRGILALIITAVSVYVMDWTALLLIPFGRLEHYSLWFTVHIDNSLSSPGFWMFLLLVFAQTAVFTATTAYLMKRSNNL